MKIDVNQIPPEGLSYSENIPLLELDLDTSIIRFEGPIMAQAQVSRITNALTVRLTLNAEMLCTCSRCLNEFKSSLRKRLDLNYPVEKLQTTVDLDPDIREELILDYPINPLCKEDCRGLCPKCGKNLNEGNCNCTD